MIDGEPVGSTPGFMGGIMPRPAGNQGLRKYRDDDRGGPSFGTPVPHLGRETIAISPG
ncbi:MAG: hypothetical protein WC382_10900 [Methanoregulaceae archaeon]